MKKKILIMTASIGSGHIKAAEALEEELASLPEVEATRVDFMERRVSKFNWLLKRLYLIMLGLVPNIYDRFFHLAGGSSGGYLSRQLFALLMYGTMQRILRRYTPDAVICTHPFPEGAAAIAKRRGGKFLLTAVLTDYSLHQIWLYPQVDIYFTATASMTAELNEQGFRAHALGIPLKTKVFAHPLPKEKIRERLNIPSANQVILLMGGGLGLGGMEETMDELIALDLPLTILAVAGRNDELQERLNQMAARSQKQILVWGYTNRVSLLMQAADLIITKPGALTVSEAFAWGLPLVLHEPIPGPETENANYAVACGAALWLKKRENLTAELAALLKDASRLRQMKKAAQKVARPRAAEDIVKVILKSIVI
ncbi:MAG: glycosyltransferase [Selenomonadaceae bacterium]|nr:glycosyltransferase [Selenomonadaceae bacterium]